MPLTSNLAEANSIIVLRYTPMIVFTPIARDTVIASFCNQITTHRRLHFNYKRQKLNVELRTNGKQGSIKVSLH